MTQDKLPIPSEDVTSPVHKRLAKSIGAALLTAALISGVIYLIGKISAATVIAVCFCIMGVALLTGLSFCWYGYFMAKELGGRK